MKPLSTHHLFSRSVRSLFVASSIAAALFTYSPVRAYAEQENDRSSSHDEDSSRRHEHEDRGGEVLPASATPFHYSLTDMAQQMAFFSVSVNNLKYYPDTPFQILYTTPTNVFRVKKGTTLFVPIIFTTDSPPPLGIFPTTQPGAEKYFFARKQLGARYFEIVVDGEVTRLGPKYVAGPVLAKNLPDTGNHFIQVGAFITPLCRGRHFLTIRSYLDGDVILEAFGAPYTFEDTYTVFVN